MDIQEAQKWLDMTEEAIATAETHGADGIDVVELGDLIAPRVGVPIEEVRGWMAIIQQSIGLAERAGALIVELQQSDFQRAVAADDAAKADLDAAIEEAQNKDPHID